MRNKTPGMIGTIIDSERFPYRAGLEGPFRFHSGIVLYYDPMEGQYYNSLTDMYVSNDDMDYHQGFKTNKNVGRI